MKNVLITGGAGFIGSTLCDRLVEADVAVTVLDNFSSGSRSNLARSTERISVIDDDVLNVDRHSQRLKGVDTVFHLAALISGYDSLSAPEQYIDTNIRGTLEVVRLCRTIGASRLVFASSSTVYGQSAEATRSEADVPSPLSVYAMSKLASEHVISMYSAMLGYSAVSLRLFNVYGPRQSPTHPYANVTCKFSHAAAVGGQVKLYGDGSQSRDFVYVDDVVDALVAVVREGRHSVYNVGTGEVTSIGQLLERAQELSRGGISIERCPPWPNDIRSIRADVSRLRDEYGVSAGVSFLDGLARTVKWFSENETGGGLR